MNQYFKTMDLFFRGRASNGVHYRATGRGGVVDIWSTESGCVWRVKRTLLRVDFDTWATRERLLRCGPRVGDKLKTLADRVTAQVNNY
jgi:hypothetical protein